MQGGARRLHPSTVLWNPCFGGATMPLPIRPTPVSNPRRTPRTACQTEFHPVMRLARGHTSHTRHTAPKGHSGATGLHPAGSP